MVNELLKWPLERVCQMEERKREREEVKKKKFSNKVSFMM